MLKLSCVKKATPPHIALMSSTAPKATAQNRSFPQGHPERRVALPPIKAQFSLIATFPMLTALESWIIAIRDAKPHAEFASLEPEDNTNALLAAYWHDEESNLYDIVTFANRPFQKPDFILQLQAGDSEQAAEWALAALQFADDHRHQTDIRPGALFTSKLPHVDGSSLNGWVIGLATIFDIPDLHLPHLALYPIYEEEVEVFKAVGLTPFLKKAGFSIYLPDRKAIKKEPR